MPRIAAAFLIFAAVLALNGVLPTGVFAKDVVAPPQPVEEISVPKSTKLISLLIVLESLRQAPVNLQSPKV